MIGLLCGCVPFEALSGYLGVPAFAIFACAITLPITHAIIPKLHSNPCDHPYYNMRLEAENWENIIEELENSKDFEHTCTCTCNYLKLFVLVGQTKTH